jgi:hypothetical protein
MHRHDLVVEARKPALILGDELGMKVASRSRGTCRSSLPLPVSRVFAP